MVGIIELHNMEFRAFHGCYELERVVGNKFLVDVTIEAEAGEAALKDDVILTINYLTVYEVVAQQMKINSNTIENVAFRILDALYLHFPSVESARVTVSKIAPALGGKVERASVTLSR